MRKEIFNHEVATKPQTPEEFIAQKTAEIEAKFGKPLDEVIAERERILGTIASLIGSDFSMKVKFGAIGGGSAYMEESSEVPQHMWNNITLDPLILAEQEGYDEFVTTHEGGHRAITRSLDKVGLKTKKELDGLASKIGWSSIRNMLEDPADNDWGCSVYPRFKSSIDPVYDPMFKEDGAIMATPHTAQLQAILGYAPDFVKFGSEVMRHWHTGGYSKGLPNHIKNALLATQGSARKYFKEIPYAYPEEKQVLEKAKKRWQIYEKEVWPFVQDLIRKDLEDEKLKQYLKDQLQKSLDQMKNSDQEGQQQQGGGGGKSLEELMEEFGLSEEEKGELREKVRQALEKKQQRQQKLQEDLRNGKIDQKEFHKKNQAQQNSFPMDMKSLMDSIKQKLEEMLANESPEVQEKAEEAAKKALEEAEDLVNEDIRAKLGKKEESHEQLNARLAQEEEEERQKAERLAQEVQERKRLEEEYKKFQDEREASRNHWQKSVSKHGIQIDDLYLRVEELFQKRTHPRWKKGYPTGQKISSLSAMQFEADPKNYLKLWERKTLPEKKDYKVLILVDLSGSTENMGIRQNEFDGTAEVAEVLTALIIDNAIVGYTTGMGENESGITKIYKDFDDDLNTDRERIELRLSGMLEQKGGWTPTVQATKIASAILASQTQRLKKNAHFLIVVTDGVPTDVEGGIENLKELRKLNKKLEKENNQIIIGMGIGPGIDEKKLREAYGEGKFVYARNQRDFPEKMADLLWAIFEQTQS